MSNTPAEHKSEAQKARTSLRCAVCTVSDTRTFETDTGGGLLVEQLESAGHQVAQREIVPDEPDRMRPLLTRWRDDSEIDAVLLTGGTGIAARDQTYETVVALLTKPLPGYGELFRMLSYEEIGSSTILSRAVGGLMSQTVTLTMPGSRAAVRLAMEKIILPELPHLVREATK